MLAGACTSDGESSDTTEFVSEDDDVTTSTDNLFDPSIVDEDLAPEVVDEVELDDDVIIATEDGQVPTTTTEPPPGGPDTIPPDTAPPETTPPPPAEQIDRVISLSPTHTDTLAAIGAGELIVGIDVESDVPEGAVNLQVDDLLTDALDIETVISLDPDLVVIGDDPFDRAPALLADAGIPVFDGAPPADLDGIQDQILELASVVGRPAEGEQVVSQMRADIDEIFASLPASDGLTYFYEIDPLLTTWAPGDLRDSLFNEIGLSSIAPSSDLGFFILDEAELFAADPDVIVLADVDCCRVTADRVAARLGWDQLAAVQNGALVELTDDVAQQFGLNVVELYRLLASAIIAAA